MTPHPTGSHVRLSPSPKGEGRKTTRLRVASNRRADWQVVLCARGARASSQGLCPPRLWRHEPQAKYNEEPPAKLVGSFLCFFGFVFSSPCGIDMFFIDAFLTEIFIFR